MIAPLVFAVLLSPGIQTQLAPVPAPPRGREIWAFRSVLDRKARRLTLALSDNLWVAYDATNCGLYKAWKGGVKFDGAVYTTAHGPQPTSQGLAYTIGETELPVWRYVAAAATKPTELRPRFRGYRFEGKKVVLQYEFNVGKQIVRVEETPEAAERDGAAVLVRDFVAKGLPSGAYLTLDRPTTVSHIAETQFTGQSLTGGGIRIDGTPSRLTTLFKRVDEIVRPTESTRRGPAAAATEPEVLPEAEDIPGLAVRVYDIGEDMNRLPSLVLGQTPNKSFVTPQVNFTKPADFGGLEDMFLVHITGNIRINRPGKYEFRLSSDDGAIFWVRDTKVVDHDGLNSGTAATGDFEFDAGVHPIRIEFFENQADELLRLEWKQPGERTFELVPPSAFSTPDGEVRVTSPGKKRVYSATMFYRPGDRVPLAGVHPSYKLTTVRPATFRPRVGGISFLPDGRMVVCNWEPEGGVYLLSGVEGEAKNVKVQRIAQGLAEPLGVAVVGKDIYVLQKQELTKLVDHNGDGVTDEYYAVANGWGVTDNFHEFAFGLAYRDGFFYATLATAINPGGASTQPQNIDRGRVIKINAKTGDYEFIASGLRTPNGIGFGYKGGLFVADNQGDWLPSSKILHVKKGAFYGSHSVDPIGTKNTPETPPVVWLPQGEIGNSPSEPTISKDGPYKGQMLHGDVTHGGVKRVFVEEVEGVLQGAVFRFTQGLEGGVNRIHWGPDGALYIGGIGSAGNWGQEGKERYGLQKISYTGAPTFEMRAVRVKSNGFEIELTEPLAAGTGDEASFYTLQSWRYVPTPDYGGPKVNERNEKIQSVTVSRDRKRIFLETNAPTEGRVFYVRLDPVLLAASGRTLWTTEAWYTLNRLPKNKTVRPNPMKKSDLKPSATELKEGFQPLFDGTNVDRWIGFRQTSVPKAWAASNGILNFTPGQPGGDLRTKDEFQDFELRLDWRISQGGNSGIIYHSTEEFGAPWMTGVEMQVLDNERHPDGRDEKTAAGAAYALMPTQIFAARPPGLWNSVRLVSKGSKVEHWLNGQLVASYDRSSDAFWKLVAASKFNGMPKFAREKKGFIVLQDHGDAVSYRNIRIRRL